MCICDRSTLAHQSLTYDLYFNSVVCVQHILMEKKSGHKRERDRAEKAKKY